MKNINRFPNRIRLHADKELKNIKDYTPKVLNRVKQVVKEDEELSSIRGEIITSATNIENHLTEAICSLIFEKDKYAEKMMKDFVFNEEHFTFNHKWRFFKAILDNLDNKNPEFKKPLDLNELKRDLKSIVETRNNFAHGEFIYTDNKSYLEFRKEGESKKIEMTEKYFEELNSFFTKVVNNLQLVIFHQK